MNSNLRARLIVAGVMASFALLLVWISSVVGEGGIDEAALVESVRNDPTDTTINQLRGSTSRESTAVLARHTSHGDPAIATTALKALGHPDRPDAVPIVTRALKDPRAKVRAAAVIALGRFDRDDVDHEVLADCMRDPSPSVRAAAAVALGNLNAWAGMENLVAALRDPNIAVRVRANRAVCHILGRDYGYDPKASAEQREAVVRRLEAEWESYADFHADYMKKLESRR